jgi:hypothetical protein
VFAAGRQSRYVLGAMRRSVLFVCYLGTLSVEPAPYRPALLPATPERGGNWTPLAKDGADLPVTQRVPREARQPMGMGETFDFEFTPSAPGNLRLELRVNGQLMARTPLRVE